MMLAYALAAMMLNLSHQQPVEPPIQNQTERFGTWEVKLRVDPVTDEVSVGGYLGNAAENVAIACAKDAPESTLIFWRSTTRFRQSGYIPRTGAEAILAGMPVGSTTYRFDQDAPVTVQTSVLQDFSSRFNAVSIKNLASRISTGSRLVLRDQHNETHTAVFNLVPADTIRMLRRLDEICGTDYSSSVAPG